jgi:hypothetical protein
VKFKLEIELGNDAMQTLDDVESILRQIVKQRDISNDRANTIRDDNGNTVGKWEVVEEDPTHRDALEWLLDIAHGDRQSYLQDGNPHSDYGDEWPESGRTMATHMRNITALAAAHGIKDVRWAAMADNYEASAKEYEEDQSETPAKTKDHGGYQAFERLDQAIKHTRPDQFIVFMDSISTGTPMYFRINSLDEVKGRKYTIVQSPKT